MFKKIIIILVILIVVGLFVYFYQKNVKNDPLGENIVATSTDVKTMTEVKSVKQASTLNSKSSTINNNSDFLVINYTKDGFSPKEIQIKKGRAVKFINNSNSSMRVILNDTKSQFYSEFSQPKSVGKNGDYIFNFVYSGSWSFHNEFNTNHKINIVVY